jgi:hypothetical protein
LYGGIGGIKKGYRHRTDVVQNENGDLVAGSYSIVARWRKYFSQLLNALYMGLIKLGRQKYTQQNNACLSQLLLRLIWLLKN